MFPAKLKSGTVEPRSNADRIQTGPAVNPADGQQDPASLPKEVVLPPLDAGYGNPKLQPVQQGEKGNPLPQRWVLQAGGEVAGITASAAGRFQRLMNATGRVPVGQPETPGAMPPAPGRTLLPGSPFQALSVVRNSTFDEYATYYLRRELDKGFTQEGVPLTAAQRCAKMPAGKMRDWFSAADWYIVRINTPQALGHLMMLDSEVSRSENLVRPNVPRLLGFGARHAKEMDYFHVPKVNRERHQDYYNVLEAGRMKLQGENRLVLCTMDGGERNQVNDTVLYYLHDGFGRALPYLTLVDEGKVTFEPVEAFLAVRREDPRSEVK